MHALRRFPASLLVVAVAVPLWTGLTGASALAQDTTTTSAPVTTTTLPPTTTTSAPTTTTTTAAATTTTRARPTTTTSHPTTTTTTTTTTATSSSSSKTWGWILLAVGIALAVILVALLIARTRRQGDVAGWRRSVVPAISTAELARELVLSQTEADDPQRRAQVAAQVDEAVAELEHAASSAPDDTGRALSTRCAESLRGLAFAVEADHLMRSGGEHPTGEQLASADAARRHRSAELDAALRSLRAAVTPER